MFNNKLIILISVVFALLNGCGGGGGGGGSSSSTTSPTLQFPIASAMSAFEQASNNYSLSAVDGSINLSLQAGFIPGSPSTFEGQLASTSTQTVSISATNTSTGASNSDLASVKNYFIASPLHSLGSIVISDTSTTGNQLGYYAVYSNQVNIPTYATVGQTGALDTYTTFTNSSKSVVYANDTETWSLSSNTSNTAWLCSFDTQTIVGSSPTTTQSCYELDTTGNVLAVKLILNINGTTVTFQ